MNSTSGAFISSGLHPSHFLAPVSTLSGHFCSASISNPASSHPATAPVVVSEQDPLPNSQRPVQKKFSEIKKLAGYGNEVFEGFPKRGAGSRPDWDLRPKMFRTKEEGAGICDLCKGTGKTRCSFCYGTHFIKENGEEIPCELCKGTDLIQCAACRGTGKQIQMTDGWEEIGFDALYARD